MDFMHLTILAFLCILASDLNLPAAEHRWSSAGDIINIPYASPFFTVKGKVYSLDDHSLKIVSSSEHGGEDKFGPYTAFNTQVLAGEVRINTVIRRYDSTNVAVLQVYFLDDVDVGKIDNSDEISTGFPCFQLNKTSDYGFMSYGGSMFGSENIKSGLWTADANIPGGMEGGPIVVFNKNNSALVFSAMSDFMITSPYLDKAKSRVCHGVMATVPKIPKKFSYMSLVYEGDSGINEAFMGWGQFLRDYYGRTTKYRDSDLILNYLGYWTDGGAFYFYNTEPNMTYQDTVLAVKENAKNLSIPYKYLQLDSWWYFKDNTSHQDVTRWEPMPSVFPDGMRNIWDKTGWPLACHNRQWSHKTPYAKANGGQFNFIVEHENEIALPVDLDFWDYLFSQARHWGLIMYEQDHLNQQTESCDAIKSDVYVGRKWLIQMGLAARQHGITLQYCMDLPRHALQSLEIPVVTHARVSGDYRGGSDQWHIGLSSIFANAIGIAPFKDCFWSTDKTQPGNPYNLTEIHPDLEIAVATLSTGPIAPADKVGYTNVSALMRCCNADGLILKPSRPALAVDDQILQMAYKNYEGPKGQVWSTFSQIGMWKFGIILAAEMQNTYSITPTKAGFRDNLFGMNMTIYNTELGSKKIMQPFSNQKPLSIGAKCTEKEFCLYYTSPLIKFKNTKVTIIGEKAKIVPVSPQRVQEINVATEEDIYITLKGAIYEQVDFYLVLDNKMLQYKCVMSDFGKAVLQMTSGGDCEVISVDIRKTGKAKMKYNAFYKDNTLRYKSRKIHV